MDNNMINWDFTNLANVEISSQPQADPFLLRCKPQDGQNGVYEMNLRFLYYPKNQSLTKYQKNQVYIKNPMNENESVMFDCPRSLGKPSIFSDLNFLLKDKKKKNQIDDATLNAINTNFRHWMGCYSPVYVIADPQHPENNGQCKVLSYGYTIKGLIEDELKDSKIKPKCQVFDFLTGKNFYYCAKKGSKYGADYDSCKFFDTPTPFEFITESGQTDVVSMAELQAMAQGQDTPLKQLLMTKLPDMENYMAKEVDIQKKTTALQYLRIILAQFPTILNDLLAVTTDFESKAILMQNGQQTVAPQPQQVAAAPQPQVANPTPQANAFQPQQATAPQANAFQPQPQVVSQAPQGNAFQPQQAPQGNAFQPQQVQQLVDAGFQTTQQNDMSQENKDAFENLMKSL